MADADDETLQNGKLGDKKGKKKVWFNFIKEVLSCLFLRMVHFGGKGVTTLPRRLLGHWARLPAT